MSATEDAATVKAMKLVDYYTGLSARLEAEAEAVPHEDPIMYRTLMDAAGLAQSKGDSIARFLTIPNAYDVRCPHCGVGPGAPCQPTIGRRPDTYMVNPHDARHHAARRRAERQAAER